MKNTLTILQKLLVTYFYEKNTGFFLAVFFILFGLPQNVKEFHLSLIDGIIKNPSFLLLVMGTWLLYNLKCTDYIIKQLTLPKQRFLYCLCNLPYITCYAYFLYVQVMVYLPVVIYVGFVATIAIQKGYTACAVEAILFMLAIVAATPLAYIRVLQQKPFFQGVALNSAGIQLPKPLFALPLFYIWRKRKQMLLISKGFSLLILFLFMRLYQPDHYDIRPALLCFMLAATANSAIVFEMKAFEDSFLQLQRNFPFSIFKRFASAVLAFVILLLPELLFIWKGYPLLFTPVDYLQLLLLGLGMLCLIYASLFTNGVDMDSIVKLAFGIMAVLFFIILYNPGILLGVAIMAIAFGIYASYYYDFEQKFK